MQYQGIFERPAGLIYDSFDEKTAIVPPFSIPDAWPRYLGLDFGGVNTAGLFYAAEPNTPHLYLYREYKAGGRTAREHAEALKAGEPCIPTCVGGSHSEGQWRDEFRAGGLPVREPDVKEVEVGIGRVYGCHKRGEIRVFSTCEGYLGQKRSYSRKLDKGGQPTEDIENKSTYHYMDSERYVIGWLRRGASPGQVLLGPPRTQPAIPGLTSGYPGLPQQPSTPGMPRAPGMPRPGVPGGMPNRPPVPGMPFGGGYGQGGHR